MPETQREPNNSDKSLAAAALPAAAKALTVDTAKQTQQLEQQQRSAGQATAPQQHTDEPFLIGTAISLYQNSGGAGTNWSTFESATYNNGKPRIQGGVKVDIGADFWNRYEEDIQRAVELNSNCFRLSLEWGRLEPVQGQWSQEGVQRYHEILDCLHRHKLTVMLTLHHFVHPQWFEDLGGFTNADNITHFVRFAEHAFREYGSKVRLWATFNEANVMGFCGWIHGTFPPAKQWNYNTAGRHMCNMFRAHTLAYNAIKQLPGGKDARVGIVHNYMAFEPLNPSWFSGLYLNPLCNILTYVWGTQVLLEYFKTGRFRWQPAFGAPVTYDEGTKPGLDFVGMNFYGRVRINWKGKTTFKPGETLTEMPYVLYPPDMYEGIKALSNLGVPVYITETGCPDSVGDNRLQMARTYFAEVERAARDGYDVRGLFFWTLLDNFEWDSAYKQFFGLFEWHPDGSQKRTMRKGTAEIAELFKRLPDSIRAARQQATSPTANQSQHAGGSTE